MTEPMRGTDQLRFDRTSGSELEPVPDGEPVPPQLDVTAPDAPGFLRGIRTVRLNSATSVLSCL